VNPARAAGLARRLASLGYEAILALAVGFFAVSAFQLAAGTAEITGWRLHLMQAFLVCVYTAYFVYCWRRGGQTLAMKAWGLRVVRADGHPLGAGRALVRFLLAFVFVPTGVGLVWALIDREGRFLHDRLAGTRLERI